MASLVLLRFQCYPRTCGSVGRTFCCTLCRSGSPENPVDRKSTLFHICSAIPFCTRSRFVPLGNPSRPFSACRPVPLGNLLRPLSTNNLCTHTFCTRNPYPSPSRTRSLRGSPQCRRHSLFPSMHGTAWALLLVRGNHWSFCMGKCYAKCTSHNSSCIWT